MNKQILNIIKPILDNKSNLAKKGKLPTYIPGLDKANLEDFGITFLQNGEKFSYGEWDKKFTIQSMSKPVVLMLALETLGIDTIFEKVGMEPSGDPFNSFMKFELSSKKIPSNPMINIGAITVSSLIPGETSEEKFELYLNFLKKITKNDSLELNEEIYLGEKRTGNRNRAIGYLLASEEVITCDVEEALDFYFKQCSVNINTNDLANIGLLLSNGGIDCNGDRILTSEFVELTSSLIASCGMYEGSGEFLAKVGIPAKSGVSGGIMSFFPNGKGGIGVYGPALDEKGNSVIGVEILKALSKNFK